MMLSRAAATCPALGARAAFLSGSPLRPQRTLPAIWIRGIAKDNKSQQPRFARPQNPPAQKASHTPPPTASSTAAPQSPSAQAAPRQSQPGSGRANIKPIPPLSAGPTRPSQASGSSEAERSTQSVPKASETEAKEQIPDLSKLPDLTQGIPSTLEYETAGSSSRSSLAPIDGEEATAGRGGRGKGELPASAYVSSSERRRQRFINYMFIGTGAAATAWVVYLGRNWDEEEMAKHPDVPNGWGVGLWWNRVTARFADVTSYYQEPAFEKLLPDPDPSFERPYTLCISLEDMLVHSEWTREHGWRVAKRPGVDYFLRYLSQYYEIVLFTTVPFAMGEPLVRKLDPFRFIMWPLYREATKYKDGEIVKDLSYLNRDLSKVIIIDTDARHVRAQPENAIVLPKWTGAADDKELVALIPFLEYIHTMQYSDVRKVLHSFEGKHIPTEFARREAIARAEFNKQLEQQRGKQRPGRKGGMGMLAGMLGMKPSNMSLLVTPDGEENPQEAFAKGKMLQDIARERGQRNYELLEKEIRENGEKWLKEEAELQEKAQKEAMKSMQSSFTSYFSGWFGVPPPQSQQDAQATQAKSADAGKHGEAV